MSDSAFRDLLDKFQIFYKTQYYLSSLTWLKTGGKAEFYIRVINLETLKNIILSNKNHFSIHIIGAGSNVIVSDLGVKGITIKLIGDFTQIQLEYDRIIVGAGCLNFNLVKFAQANSLSGFEFLSGIPGTLGGAISTNAGAYGSEIKDLILCVEAIDNIEGKLYKFEKDECQFSYRSNNLPKNLIFTKLHLRAVKGDRLKINSKIQDFNNFRSRKQPKNKTCGSVFLNPPNMKAWELIDSLGLRNKIIGGAKISDIHCNFIQNFHNAKSQDVFDLIKLVKNMVKKHHKINLDLEVKILGNHNIN
ncbi:MAG: UDP-N-acetylmuramate dehydrogenase [Rickettsia sp.]|nr:UDP-N-acetylmuramate dehydrogenase [Rickettsia sp.]